MPYTNWGGEKRHAKDFEEERKAKRKKEKSQN